ncbi:hypothetical protein K435DRAFT_851559 [Dendrothele bispora CBS 962.96]|uniref:Uncharacterized protein n=1 Tax=Dendrothele bispora (strain CBS 962.96) TaxID=1314807 RepID=A0A4S8MM89_DENBC|nr:hypothetical protein K435DRAFT_851559 [Dendrothele bispora CBS 962.96]
MPAQKIPIPTFPNNLVVEPNGKVHCPNCHKKVGVGTGGLKNFEKRHWMKDRCTEDGKVYRLTQKKPLVAFLRPRTELVPLQVSTSKTVAPSQNDNPVPPSQESTASCSTSTLPPTTGPFRTLQMLALQVPDGTPTSAGLEVFLSEPTSLLGDTTDSTADILLEKVVNPLLHKVFQGKSDSELENMVKFNRKGVIGFCTFARYVTEVKNIPIGLLEARSSRLEKAVTTLYPHALVTEEAEGPLFESTSPSLGVDINSQAVSLINSDPMIQDVSPPVSLTRQIIDVDSLSPDDNGINPIPMAKGNNLPVSPSIQTSCRGYIVPLSAELRPCRQYPWLLHDIKPLQWDPPYIDTVNQHMAFHAIGCCMTEAEGNGMCRNCYGLSENSSLSKIVQRM